MEMATTRTLPPTCQRSEPIPKGSRPKLTKPCACPKKLTVLQERCAAESSTATASCGGAWSAAKMSLASALPWAKESGAPTERASLTLCEPGKAVLHVRKAAANGVAP